MKLDETTLIEILYYINALDEKVGLKSETVEDIRNAINKHKSELKNLRLVAVIGAKRKVCPVCKKTFEKGWGEFCSQDCWDTDM